MKALKLFGNRRAEANTEKPQDKKKFDTADLGTFDIEKILSEQRAQPEGEGPRGAQNVASDPTMRIEKDAVKADVKGGSCLLKRWHKVCLLIAFSVLAIGLAAFALAKTYVKPPDNQGEGIRPSHSVAPESSKPGTPVPTAKPSEPTEEDPEPTDPGTKPAINKNVYNIILAGFDDIEGSVHTDTLMVLSYNADKNTVNIVSVPRDTYCNTGWTATKKINSAYAIGGIETLSRELKKIMGFECDYYILVSMSAMEELVEAIGGVEYDVPYRMHYRDPVQSLLIDLYPGPQTLNGKQAVQLCRWRQNNDGFTGGLDGDLGRIEMQQDFIIALAKQCLSIKNIAKNIGNYAEIFSKNVTSNLTKGEMIWFGLRFLDVGVENIQTFTLEGYATMYQDLSYYFLYASKVAKMMDEYFNPYDDHAITTADLNIFVPTFKPSTSPPEPGGASGPGGDTGGQDDDPAEPGTDPGAPPDEPVDPGTDPYYPGDGGELDGAFG
jgi:LCP family protein required for cell wall assembly